MNGIRTKDCLCQKDSQTLQGALEDLEAAFKVLSKTFEELKIRRSKLPRFYGHFTQNVSHFLCQVNSYLYQEGGFTDEGKVDFIFNLLHGPAREWAEHFLNPEAKGEKTITYGEFQCGILTQFSKK